eukprot:CAMPEP_0116875918 /NCGR_PEP_ID=MMETSP0463-20121206/8019_1 /TAXON_ID=181622 /ORGANISM="Strombidinopsis sp, Strain SopsisLIS2011" /LENGTH=121 /DNA_ID=CAMNT_0004522321 /DNA_START=181 /DNA_END=546 /DNA_ORIENTATION=+
MAKKGALGGKSKGGKTKKKSWTKVKVKDKLNNAVFLDQKQYDRCAKEVPKILMITRSILSEKFKINGAVSRALIKDLASKGLIRRVGDHTASFDLYSGIQAKSALEKAAEEAAALEAKQKK